MVQVPGADGLPDAQGAADVTGPDGAGEAVLGGVGEPDRVRLVLEGQDDGDGAEDLLDGHPRVGLDAGEDGGREPEAGAFGGSARIPGVSTGTYERTRSSCTRRSAGPSASARRRGRRRRRTRSPGRGGRRSGRRPSAGRGCGCGRSTGPSCRGRPSEPLRRRPRCPRRRRRCWALAAEFEGTRLSRAEPFANTCLPTAVDPVNTIFATPGCSTSALPATGPWPEAPGTAPRADRPPEPARPVGAPSRGSSRRA